ncbi:hypothetical protein FQV26_04435 [Planococcus sp. CPCC 101016]|uniref:hypothetical protein n=1 Tax=Planococcus sp. CPCC 101016 TaxID=2599617 RepID=UPI0011B6D835|nr:hypothetical protein [Planococcus sp. CPCC 101016]TWT07066.1 hypothetical protein FQV26_04435 [Planococcus sp. CPCC 101016]
MEQSRPRYEEKSFLIVGNRSWFRACIDFVLSLFFWLYGLVVVLFFLLATFGFNTTLTKIINSSLNTINQDIRNLVIVAIAVFLLSYALLYINRLYNKKKFGALKRRSYPAPVCNEDLKALGLLDIETIEKLQREDYSVFDTNPIAPLGGEKL